MSASISIVALLWVFGLLGAHTPVAGAQEQKQGTPRSFEACRTCHTLDKTNGIGPSLLGIVGREAGSMPGFRYSRAMRNAKTVWDERTLDAFLADPQKVIPGNVMPFGGIADDKERAEVIEYLKTLKESNAPRSDASQSSGPRAPS